MFKWPTQGINLIYNQPRWASAVIQYGTFKSCAWMTATNVLKSVSQSHLSLYWRVRRTNKTSHPTFFSKEQPIPGSVWWWEKNLWYYMWIQSVLCESFLIFFLWRLVTLMAFQQIQRSSLSQRFDPTTGKEVMGIIAKLRNSASAAGHDEIFFISCSISHWHI